MREEYSIQKLPTGEYYVCKGEYCWQNETFDHKHDAFDFVVKQAMRDGIIEACDWFDKQSSARTITSMLRSYADELVKEG